MAACGPPLLLLEGDARSSALPVAVLSAALLAALLIAALSSPPALALVVASDLRPAPRLRPPPAVSRASAAAAAWATKSPGSPSSSLEQPRSPMAFSRSSAPALRRVALGLAAAVGLGGLLGARLLRQGTAQGPSERIALATVTSEVSPTRPPPSSSGGLVSSNFHVSQVPASDAIAAQYRGVDLPHYVPTHTYAAVIVGGGPAGLALALNLAKGGASVVVVDNALAKDWPNNYGVWVDEWAPLGLPPATLGIVWDTTVIRYTAAEATRLPRAYARVDRKVTKEHFLRECVARGVHFCAGAAAAVAAGQGEASSAVQLVGGEAVRGQVPIVAAGHYSRLVKYHSPGEEVVGREGDHMTKDWRQLIVEGEPGTNPWGWQYRQGGAPGYQIAYGIEVETDGPHGYPLNEMVLMDWSGEHLAGHPREREWSKVPTFLYVMPTDETHVFLEETSLTSRPALSFEDCQQRLEVRLRHHGVKVKQIFEVENCVIPMGGPLPLLGQRVVAYGAATNLVHPATGYMMNRSVVNSGRLAAALVGALDARRPMAAVTAAAWDAVWPAEALRVRDFQVFGMEVILNMDLDQCRQFFRTFFRDPSSLVWRQYLAMQLNTRECLEFALGLFANCSPTVKLRFMVDGVTRDGVAVLKSLLGL